MIKKSMVPLQIARKEWEYRNGFWLAVRSGELVEERDIYKYFMHNFDMTADQTNKLLSTLRQVAAPEKYYPQIKIEMQEGKSEFFARYDDLYPGNNFRSVFKYFLFEKRKAKAFILKGIGGSGKSTFLTTLQSFFTGFTSTLVLENLNGFRLADIIGKLVIVGDDCGGKMPDNTGILKTIISGDSVSVEPKFCPVLTLFPVTKMIFSTNKPISLDVTDSGLIRRFEVLELDKKIPLSEQKEEFKENIVEQLPIIAYEAFNAPDYEWQEEISQIKLLVWRGYGDFIRNGIFFTYKHFLEWCDFKKRKPLSEENFESLIENYDFAIKSSHKEKEDLFKGIKLTELDDDEELPFP